MKSAFRMTGLVLFCLSSWTSFAAEKKPAVDPVITPEGDQRKESSSPGEAIPGTSVRPEGMDQSNVPKTPMDRKGAVAEDVGASNQNSNKAPLAAAERDFLMMANQIDMGEIASAELALKRSKSAELRTFAQMMQADHKPGHKELVSLAKRNGVVLDDKPDAKHAAMSSALEKTTGTGFDRLYMSQQIEGHGAAVAGFEKASGSSADSEIKAFADQALPMLRKHLAEAKRIHASMGAMGASAQQ